MDKLVQIDPEKRYCIFCPYLFEEECFFPGIGIIDENKYPILRQTLSLKGKDLSKLCLKIKKELRKIDSKGILFAISLFIVPESATVSSVSNCLSIISKSISDDSYFGYRIEISEDNIFEVILYVWEIISKKEVQI